MDRRTKAAGCHPVRHSLSVTAFVTPVLVMRDIPKCSSHSSPARRPRRAKSSRAPPSVKLDPILDDGDIDMTDITTFVSCPVCYNSIMLRPEQLADGPMRIVCNCCGKPSSATMHRLENMDGTPFDLQGWKASRAVSE